MEITIDIGKHVAKQIADLAKSENVDFDIAALRMLDLGLRVHESSSENNAIKEPDPLLLTLLDKVLVNHFLMQETLGHVFVKERSMLKTYDALSAISVAEHRARSFVDGRVSCNGSAI